MFFNFMATWGSQPGRRRWRDLATGLFVACLSATVAQGLRATPLVQDAEWRLFSRFAKARDPVQYAGPLTVVEIDDNAYAGFAIKSPVPRDRLAAVIATLCQQAHPRAIGLDILLDRPSPPGHELEDEALEDALKQAHRQGVPIVLACEPLPGKREPAAFPLPRFRRWAALGHVDVPVSASGDIREAQWQERSMGKTFPALAAALAARAAGVPEAGTEAWLASRLRPRGRYGRFIYYQPDAEFPALPINSLSPQFPERLHKLDGKVVLVGATAAWAGDFHRTPLRSLRFGANWPGVDIQAAMAATLLAPGIQTPSPQGEWLLSAIVSGLFLAGFYRIGTGRALLASAALLPLAALGSLCLFAFEGWLLNLVPCLLAMLACVLAWGVRRSWYWQRCFDTFLTRPVHRGLGGLNNLEDMGVATGTASILFCDLIGYSRACRSLTPQETLALSNHYLAPLIAITDRHGGLLDKFMGDGCLAYFGAPLPGQKPLAPAVSAAHAVQAGLEMQETARQLAEEAPQRGLPALALGVGIHTGLLSTGLVGGKGRMQFTVMGDTVNDACRVESIGHQPAVLAARTTGVLISAATLALLPAETPTQKISYLPTEKYAAPVYEVQSPTELLYLWKGSA